MPNKNVPRKITLAALTLTRIDSIQKRTELLMLNVSGADVGLTTDSAESAIADCYPVASDSEFVDKSQSPLYAISTAGGDIWVWETDV
jgi:hypothetical protein